MINGISIENFRCFHKTDIQGFGLVNLIGGKNNVGKTSLLEGIYVGLKGDFETIKRLRSHDQVASYNEDEYLYFNQNLSSGINIEILKGILKYHAILKDSIFSERYFKQDSYGDYNEYVLWDENRSAQYTIEEHKFRKSNNASIIHSKNTQFPINLILSQEYDKVDRLGESDEILKAIQVIEPNIAEIKTYSDRPNVLHLRLKNQKQRMPISYFGDAIQKVMRYIITIASFHNQNGENTEGGKYLLIDEIENGLHYTVQEEFWEMVFKLAIAYDIQIFAATHSLEMIKAFAKIAMKYEDKAAYFEMFRHIKTDEIAANRILPESLNYKLEHNRPLRGE